MNITKKLAISLLSAGAMIVALNCHAQEQKIQRSELPPAVEAKVAAESAGATIKGFSREKEKGQVFYEMELEVNGHGKDVLMDASGAIVEVEEEVSVDALPPAVKDALNAKVKNGKITKVESLTKHDKLVAYEADVVIDGKRSEIQVGPDGKPLAHEE
jgi:uncharacterized membrane protein YkoI